MCCIYTNMNANLSCLPIQTHTSQLSRYNKTAADIVCDNAKSSSTALRDKISDLMKGKYIHVHCTFRDDHVGEDTVVHVLYLVSVQPRAPRSKDIHVLCQKCPNLEVAQKHRFTCRC